MRVLHVYKCYFPEHFGGVEQAIRHLVTGTKAHGISAEVFTLSPNAQDEPVMFEDHRVNQAKTTLEISSTPMSIEAFTKFRNLAKNFDLIHYHYPYPFADLLSLTCAPSVPSIVTYHSDIVRQRILKYGYWPLQSVFLSHVDRIICTSLNYMQTSSVLRTFKHKTEPISLGLDEALLPQASELLLQKWKKAFPKPFILFLGALRNYKGVSTLIQAAKGFNGDVVIAGAGSSLHYYKKKVKAAKLENVYFTGFVDDVDKAALLQLCTALVLPSHFRSEAFGLVQLEAALKAKPVICTELGTGTTFVNEHENTGLVVPPKDADALRNAMAFLMQHPIIAGQMGMAARSRFQELFTAARMCKEYARIYYEVVSDAANGDKQH